MRRERLTGIFVEVRPQNDTVLLVSRAIEEELVRAICVSFGGGRGTASSLTVGSRATTLSESRYRTSELESSEQGRPQRVRKEREGHDAQGRPSDGFSLLRQ